jgi:tripartite-type tricarboxylate transporter receptor subunit TctC
MSWARMHITALVLLTLNSGATAQNWPTKPFRVVVSWPAGGATDVVARAVCDQLSSQLGEPFVVENRGGASGTIGAALVARSEPDGYTILITSSSYATAPAALSDLPFDPVKDLAAVAPLGGMPLVLVASPSKGYHRVRDIIADAKGRTRPLSYASTIGSSTHFVTEAFRRQAGFEAVNIPYKGAPEALPDVMTGRVDFYFSPLLPALPLIKSGQLTALAVAGSEAASALPEVPTLQQEGFTKLNYILWIGMFVSAKTPRGLVDKLHDETRRALEASDIQQKLISLGTEPFMMEPTEFDAHVKIEIEMNEELSRAMTTK